MRIGVPLSSVNCLEATGFFPFDSGADAMRVPRPAAGMMATTFMASPDHILRYHRFGGGAWARYSDRQRHSCVRDCTIFEVAQFAYKSATQSVGRAVVFRCCDRLPLRSQARKELREKSGRMRACLRPGWNAV